MIPNLGFGEIALIAGVVVILFGAKKIPEAARGLGRSLKEFKKGLSEGEKEDEKEGEKKEGAEPTEKK